MTTPERDEFERLMKEEFPEESLALAAEWPYYASYVTCCIVTSYQSRQPEIDALKAEVERLRKDAERHQYLKEMEKMFRYESHYNGTRSISEVYEMIRLNACAAMSDKGE